MRFSYGNVFLTYVNELCIYLKFCLSSSQFQLRLRIDNGSANQYVLLIELFSYVKESIYLIGSLPFFKTHVNHLWPRVTHIVPILSQNAFCG